MIFVDTNVFMYAVGREHPLKAEARAFMLDEERVLVTSAEVLQELLHIYLPTDRMAVLDQALALARGRLSTIWSVEPDDVELARTLADRHRGLDARALMHVACCTRRGVSQVKTFDRALAAAFPAAK